MFSLFSLQTLINGDGAFNDELDAVGVQGTLTHNNIAYFLKSNRHAIYSYSLLTLNNLYINNYPVRNNLGIYVGECEQISVMSETNKKPDFFAISGQIDIQYGWWYNVHCWRTNLFNDLTDKTYLPDYLILNRVYIDTESTDPVSDGSIAHPFHTPRNCASCSRLLARNCY